MLTPLLGQLTPLTSTTRRAYLAKVLATSPLAYWPMDDLSGTTMTDRSGNNRNGTYANSPTLGEPSAVDTASVRFNGTNHYTNAYTASLGAAFSGSECTLFVRAKVEAGEWALGTLRSLEMMAADSINNYITIRKFGINTLAGLYIAGGVAKTLTITITSEAWFTVALTVSKSADQAIVYYNGTQSGATQTGLGTFVGSLNFQRASVGNSTGISISSPWRGWIDDAMVWNRALTAAEIASFA